MPVATPFKSFGSIDATNPDAALLTGFPYKLDKIDVSGEDFWTTLSGFNKLSGGSPSDSSIFESLENAMKLFWNVSEMLGEASADATESVRVSITTTEETAVTPEGRVCFPFISQSNSDEYIDGIPPFTTTTIVTMRITIIPVRMYDGDTSDESNFVGYGIKGGSIASAEFIPGPVVTAVEFRSYVSAFDLNDLAYTTLSGIPIVGHAIVGQNKDPANLEATLDGDIAVSRIDSLDFYTYP